ncbi:MAG: DUF928 domain-containing protein [Elainellaceae cyanobacterium]
MIYAKSDRQGSESRPGEQSATDARGDCPSVAYPLTALMPQSNVGNTLLGHPTFWFYVPYSQEQIPVGKFVLYDETGSEAIAPIDFTLPEQVPGYVSFTLPESVPELNMGQFYRWYFELYCDPDEPTYVDVNGWVQRLAMSSDLNDQLSNASPRTSQALLQGIWYDAIAQLANLRLMTPNNTALKMDWQTALQRSDVGLTQIPDAPLIGEVRIE